MNRVLKWSVAVVLLITLVVSVAWVVMSHQTFPNELLPGQTYMVGDRKYKVPNRLHRTYGTKVDPSYTRKMPMLDEQLLIELRELTISTFEALRASNTDFWVSGGTLISAELWGHQMPYDDDCDVHADWNDREYLWSPEFGKVLEEYGLESFFLRGATLDSATREGAGVRVRKKGTITPTIDIFFVKEREDGKYIKVNSWNHGKLGYNHKEVWESRDWVYPIQWKDIDDMQWPVPNQPKKMLAKQYSDNVFNIMESPAPLTMSHQFVFKFTNLVKAWRVGEVSKKPMDACLNHS